MSDPEAQRQIAFPRLEEEEVAELAEIGTRRRLRDGERLFTAGEKRPGFNVVLSGSVEILDVSDGEPRRITVHQPGEFTGDIDIVGRRPTVATAVARGETEVLQIGSEEIRRIIAEWPTVGERILHAFIARRELLMESGFVGLRVIGSGDSRDAFRIREFLARNQVPFTWIDLDEDPGVADLLREFGLGTEHTPVVAYGGRPLLRNPSTRALAETVGLRPPLDPDGYDLVVIGAGPAGLAAAVYGASEGLRTLVLDAAAPGGQAGASTKIENYLGFPTGISGSELASRATLQAQKFGASFSTPSEVVGLDCSGERPVVELAAGERVSARCLLIATGADYRRLDVPGRERFDGLGVYYAATQTELVSCRGSDVVVVGGGNSAGQAVMFLSEHTGRVLLLLRGDDLRKSMSSYLAARIEEAENVEVLFRTEVQRVVGEHEMEGVEVREGATGRTRTLPTPALFTFIGAVPRTAWLPPWIDTDAHGFIQTGRAVEDSASWPSQRPPMLLETSQPGVFAAGDVRIGSIKRVASAVGEGAMAIKLVHEFLTSEAVKASS